MTQIYKTPYAFIPKRLEIENRTDLQVFPNKVVFASYKMDDHDRLICGSSLYTPLLETLEQTADHWEMRYANEFGSDCWLRIIYYPDNGIYGAEKHVKGQLVQIAGGADWKGFFIHLTMAGLQNGEDCIHVPRTVTTIERAKNRIMQ